MNLYPMYTSLYGLNLEWLPAKHRIGSEYFKDIALYLCINKYPRENVFKRYVFLLGSLFGADYFQ